MISQQLLVYYCTTCAGAHGGSNLPRECSIDLLVSIKTKLLAMTSSRSHRGRTHIPGRWRRGGSSQEYAWDISSSKRTDKATMKIGLGLYRPSLFKPPTQVKKLKNFTPSASPGSKYMIIPIREKQSTVSKWCISNTTDGYAFCVEEGDFGIIVEPYKQLCRRSHHCKSVFCGDSSELTQARSYPTALADQTSLRESDFWCAVLVKVTIVHVHLHRACSDPASNSPRWMISCTLSKTIVDSAVIKKNNDREIDEDCHNIYVAHSWHCQLLMVTAWCFDWCFRLWDNLIQHLNQTNNGATFFFRASPHPKYT